MVPGLKNSSLAAVLPLQPQVLRRQVRASTASTVSVIIFQACVFIISFFNAWVAGKQQAVAVVPA